MDELPTLLLPVSCSRRKNSHIGGLQNFSVRIGTTVSPPGEEAKRQDDPPVKRFEYVVEVFASGIQVLGCSLGSFHACREVQILCPAASPRGLLFNLQY